MSGKGSRPRPFSVSQQQFDLNWDSIFKKKAPAIQCSKCGANRAVDPCPLDSTAIATGECPMTGRTQSKG